MEDDAVPPARLQLLDPLERGGFDGRPLEEALFEFLLDSDERFQCAAVVCGVVRSDLGRAQEAGDLLVAERLLPVASPLSE